MFWLWVRVLTELMVATLLLIYAFHVDPRFYRKTGFFVSCAVGAGVYEVLRRLITGGW